MIEYSIGELKYHYSKYNVDDDNNDVLINHLEDTVSNLINEDHTHNTIYHLFPAVVCSFLVTAVTFVVLGSSIRSI